MVDLGNAAERAALAEAVADRQVSGAAPTTRATRTVPESSIIIEYLTGIIRPHPVHSGGSRSRVADTAARPVLRSLPAFADAEDHG